MSFARVEMSNKMSENERRIVYLSVLVVAVLAILLGLSNDQTYSAVTVLFIVIIVIGNIIYFYRRMKRTPEEKKAGTN
jgi:undecaprenyl pyrophosphate phosphatase UppP